MAGIDDVATGTSVGDDHAFFKGMLDLVPQYFYEDMTRTQSQSFTDEQSDSEETGDQLPHKRKKEITKKTKRKQAKFDPAQKDVDVLNKDVVTTTSKHKKPSKVAQDDFSDDDDDDGLGSSVDSMEDLREKLHAKIESLQARRKVLNRADFTERQRLKRRVSKMRLKMRRKTEKQGKAKVEAVDADVGVVAAPPILNADGKMVFSKFDFTGTSGGEKKGKAAASKGKDFRRLLEQATKRKTEEKAVREAGGGGAAGGAAGAHQWKAAMQRAEGVKVRDDPVLLRQSLKRKEKRKEKSAQAWEERGEKVEAKQKGRQDKRKRNLKKRKQANVDKKMKHSKKKGHIIPGF